MQTIVVSTDFSEEAENAAAYAAGLARQIRVRVILFNSFTLPVHAANARLSASSIDSLEEHNRSLLEEKASRLAESFGIEVDYESSFLTSIYEGLDDLMVRYQAEFIVMGMAPRTLGQDLFGNTTTSVIMKLKYPVLAIPLGVRFDGIRKILFACEAYRDVPPPIIEKIKSLASRVRAEIGILHVSGSVGTPEDERYERLAIEEGFADVPHHYKVVRSEGVIDQIAGELRTSKAEMLIMIPRKYGFWESLVHRSKTRLMASNNEVPLFSIPA